MPGAAHNLVVTQCLATDASHLCCSRGAIQVVAEELRHPSEHHPLKPLKPDKVADHLFQMGEAPAGCCSFCLCQKPSARTCWPLAGRLLQPRTSLGMQAMSQMHFGCSVVLRSHILGQNAAQLLRRVLCGVVMLHVVMLEGVQGSCLLSAACFLPRRG